MKIWRVQVCGLLVLALLLGTGPAWSKEAKTYINYSRLPAPQATSEGESIYKESGCALCHGELGDGEGFLAGGLDPKPRDFTSFKEMQRIPHMSMVSAIKHGVKGTAMPAHPDFSNEQIEELITYLRSLLAQTQTTVTICMLSDHVIDTGKIGWNLDQLKIKVENPELLKVTREGSKVTITPNKSPGVMKKIMKKKVIRTHVKFLGKDSMLSLVAVRLRNCLR